MASKRHHPYNLRVPQISPLQLALNENGIAQTIQEQAEIWEKAHRSPHSLRRNHVIKTVASAIANMNQMSSTRMSLTRRTRQPTTIDIARGLVSFAKFAEDGYCSLHRTEQSLKVTITCRTKALHIFDEKPEFFTRFGYVAGDDRGGSSYSLFPLVFHLAGLSRS